MRLPLANEARAIRLHWFVVTYYATNLSLSLSLSLSLVAHCADSCWLMLLLLELGYEFNIQLAFGSKSSSTTLTTRGAAAAASSEAQQEPSAGGTESSTCESSAPSDSTTPTGSDSHVQPSPTSINDGATTVDVADNSRMLDGGGGGGDDLDVVDEDDGDDGIEVIQPLQSSINNAHDDAADKHSAAPSLFQRLKHRVRAKSTSTASVRNQSSTPSLGVPGSTSSLSKLQKRQQQQQQQQGQAPAAPPELDPLWAITDVSGILNLALTTSNYPVLLNLASSSLFSNTSIISIDSLIANAPTFGQQVIGQIALAAQSPGDLSSWLEALENVRLTSSGQTATGVQKKGWLLCKVGKRWERLHVELSQRKLELRQRNERGYFPLHDCKISIISEDGYGTISNPNRLEPTPTID
jgi:hypothetical protein